MPSAARSREPVGKKDSTVADPYLTFLRAAFPILLDFSLALGPADFFFTARSLVASLAFSL
jgi:hypothetical protein